MFVLNVWCCCYLIAAYVCTTTTLRTSTTAAPAPPSLPACCLPALLAKLDGAAATPYASPHEVGGASADASRQPYNLSPCRVLCADGAYSAPQLALVCDWLRELAQSCVGALKYS